MYNIHFFYHLKKRCDLPPRDQQPLLQYLHIPKTSTSINWFLHDYFDCFNQFNDSNEPCSKWLENVNLLSYL